MKAAREEIIEVHFKGSLYYVSIVEKENDSGIMYNDRTFFLLPEKTIGYLSEAKIDDPPEKLDFDKAKILISIPQIKTVVVLERELHIKLVQAEASKKIEKDWILRMSSAGLAKKWYDRLHHEKMTEMQKKSTPKNDKSKIPQQFKGKKSELKVSTPKNDSSSRFSPPKKVLQITRSQSFTYNVKPEKVEKVEKIDRVETGVGGTPDNSELSFKNKGVEMKEAGTFMSEKTESVKPRPQPQMVMVEKQEQPQEQLIQRTPQNTAIVNKVSKQPLHEGKSDRSFAEVEKAKSIRSQPVSRKVQPFKFNRKEQEPLGELQQKPKSKANSNLQKEEELKLSTSGIKSIELRKEEVQQGQREDPPQNLALSNKHYISQEQFEKLNTSTPFEYLERTSKLIHSSTSKLQIPQNSKNNNEFHQSRHDLPQSFKISNEPSQSKLRLPSFSHLSSKSKINEPSQSILRFPQSSKNSNEPPSYIPMSIEKTKEARTTEKLSQTVPEANPAKSTEAKAARSTQVKPSPTASRNIKFSIPELNEQYDDLNESDQLHRVIKEEFSSIKREPQDNEEAFISELPLPWTFKYLQFGDRIFEEFLAYCKDLLQAMVEDLRLPAHKQTFNLKFMRSGVRYYEIDDVEAKLALISIEDAREGQGQLGVRERVCNRSAIKQLKNEFNNFHLLYQHLQPDWKVKVPLVCLCEANGFIALFKILSVGLDRQVRMRDIEGEIAELRLKTKINHSFYQNHNKNFIQLDEKYYRGIHPDSRADFNCFFIQEIEEYLPADPVADCEGGVLLRKELVSRYADPPEDLGRSRPIQKLHERAGKEAERLSQHLLQAISETVLELDSLSAYFLSSHELAEYFHQRGVNLRYLGHVYRHLSLPFQRRVLMSEMAARSCKALLRKTLQDIVMEEEVSPQTVTIKVCDFLNCVTSNNIETAALWKVLSAHSRAYFGLQLNFEQIDRGYFLASLVENCRLKVAWQRLNPQDVFKQSLLFTQKNLLGVGTECRTYLPHHSPLYLRCLEVLHQPHSEQAIPELKEFLQLAENHPAIWGSIAHPAKLYLSLFLSPSRAKEEMGDLALYPSAARLGPSRELFDLMLMQIKWQLKGRSRQGYIKSCDQFIRTASKFFGEFHPVFSQLYDVFSAYHQGALEFEDAITFAKSSLVNVLKVCGTSHERTSECYYNLALCHIKAGRKEEAFAHISKARAIFEATGRTHSLPYAAISLKLALVYLNQDQTDLCLTAALAALEIFAREPIATCEEELVDCFEMVARCYQILQERGKMQEVAERCQGVLTEVSASHNLERLLKIIVYPMLSQATPEHASLYLDVISQLPSPAEGLAATALPRLRVRIGEQTLLPNLDDYLANLPEIEQYLREVNLLQEWESFSEETYPRETINDFLALTEELMAFLGEGFVSGSLREAL